MSKFRYIARRPAFQLVLLMICALFLAWPLTQAVQGWSWLTLFYYWFAGWGLVIIILFALSRHISFFPRAEGSEPPKKPAGSGPEQTD